MPIAHPDVQARFDGTCGFSTVRGVQQSNLERKVNLIIDEPHGNDSHFRLKVQSPLFDADEDNWEDDIPLTSEKLWGHVVACRRAWYQAVYYKEDNRFPLQEQWDFTGRPELKEQLLPKLAIAGARLFESIFFPEQPSTEQPGFVRLRKIGDKLRALSKEHPLCMRVTSDDFYAPWNLIYSHELKDRVAGSDYTKEGFWGYQHLVEHTPNSGCRQNEFAPDWPLQIGVHVDRNIDSKLNVSTNRDVLAQLLSYEPSALSLVERSCKLDLSNALGQDPRPGLQDHILYFCCHATVEGDTTPLINESYLALTDSDEHITTSDLDFWIGRRKFARYPIIFLNACQSAQMNSVFYQGFAPIFLSRDASTVIGTQTEIPAVFAGEFARRFFEEFFQGDQDETKLKRQIGTILLKMRQEFLDVYNNPLGLLYSLYRGADVHLSRPVPRKSSTQN